MLIKNFASAIACAVALLAGSLAGCGTAATQDQSASPAQQSGTTTVPQTTTQSGSEMSGQPTQPPPGMPDMTAVLTRAAEMLGVAPDKFITAFENARPQGGPPGDGQQGQPPAPPSGQQPGQPGTQFMTEIATKMAAELNISADKIEAALSQAQQEISK